MRAVAIDLEALGDTRRLWKDWLADAVASCGAAAMSAARATETGATLAVGQDIARSLMLTRLGAVILGLVTVLTAMLLAVVTYRARSRTLR